MASTRSPPNINPPQSAILAVGRIVVGATAARFMADLRTAIEQPDALL